MVAKVGTAVVRAVAAIQQRGRGVSGLARMQHETNADPQAQAKQWAARCMGIPSALTACPVMPVRCLSSESCPQEPGTHFAAPLGIS